MQPKADTLLLNEKTKKIAAILKRREQLQEDRKREHNRPDKLLEKEIIKSIKRHIQCK